MNSMAAPYSAMIPAPALAAQASTFATHRKYRVRDVDAHFPKLATARLDRVLACHRWLTRCARGEPGPPWPLSYFCYLEAAAAGSLSGRTTGFGQICPRSPSDFCTSAPGQAEFALRCHVVAIG